MNILVDQIGHADLSYSMHLLFEKRLGWNVYSPDGGPGWAQYAVWTSPLHPHTNVEVDGFDCIQVPTHSYLIKTVTLQQFIDMNWDFIISTCTRNENPLLTLAKQHKPGAKVVRQIANVGEQAGAVKNVLLSTMTPMHPGTRTIKYYPEHRSDFVHDPSVPVHKKIKSYFNYFHTYAADIGHFRTMRTLLPEFEMVVGGGAHRPDLDRTVLSPELPKDMQQQMFVWHTKPMGCCGYTVRQALTCGKPIIFNSKYSILMRTLAQEYLQDGVNAIDINPSVRSLQEAATIIRAWSVPGVYDQKVQDVLRLNNIYMNFEAQATNIKNWLLGL